jgi:hypothetical protein
MTRIWYLLDGRFGGSQQRLEIVKEKISFALGGGESNYDYTVVQYIV